MPILVRNMYLNRVQQHNSNTRALLSDQCFHTSINLPSKLVPEQTLPASPSSYPSQQPLQRLIPHQCRHFLQFPRICPCVSSRNRRPDNTSLPGTVPWTLITSKIEETQQGGRKDPSSHLFYKAGLDSYDPLGLFSRRLPEDHKILRPLRVGHRIC